MPGWASRWGRGPLGHAQDIKRRSNAAAGLRSLSPALAVVDTGPDGALACRPQRKRPGELCGRSFLAWERESVTADGVSCGIASARRRVTDGVDPVSRTPDGLRRPAAKGWCLSCREPALPIRRSSVVRRSSCCARDGRRASCLRAWASLGRRCATGVARTRSIAMSVTTVSRPMSAPNSRGCGARTRGCARSAICSSEPRPSSRRRADPVSCYRIVLAEKAHTPVSVACELLGVSTSGFYAWGSGAVTVVATVR